MAEWPLCATDTLNVEGMIKQESMTDDFYQFDEERMFFCRKQDQRSMNRRHRQDSRRRSDLDLRQIDFALLKGPKLCNVRTGKQLGQAVKNVQRLRQVTATFAKYGFADVVVRMNLGAFCQRG